MNNPLPDPAEWTAHNATLHATALDSGFWDEQGRPAPCPDDIDEWRPSNTHKYNPKLSQQAL